MVSLLVYMTVILFAYLVILLKVSTVNASTFLIRRKVIHLKKKNPQC